MPDSEFVLVRRADLATHMTKAPTVYPAWSDAHDRLRAALSADQTEDVARSIAGAAPTFLSLDHRTYLPSACAVLGAEMTCPETEPSDGAGMGSGSSHTWQPGDPCGACGSTRTVMDSDPTVGARCLSCGACDDDE